MALNLWTLGGQPSSYNPLPTSTLDVRIPIGKEYIFSFKAKSFSRATIRVSSYSSVNDIYESVILTPELKDYSFNWSETDGGALYLNDVDDNGDIIIEDIELVEKPLGKATINGISNDVNDWEQGTIASANGLDYSQSTRIRLKSFVPVTGNTECYIVASGTFLIAFQYDDKFNYINNFSGNWESGAGWKFKTASNTKYLRFAIKLDDVTTVEPSLISSVKPMLNLGSIPAPYEPKRGDRMVMPVAKKNLLASDISTWEQGTYQITTGSDAVSTTRLRSNKYYEIKQKVYTVSCTENYELSIVQYDSSRNLIAKTDVWQKSGYSFTPVDGAITLRVFLRKLDDSIILPDEVSLIKPQLEEGTTATPYEPYAVQVNNKRKVSVPKKNLFDGRLEYGYWGTSTGATATKVSTELRIKSVDLIPVKPSTTYAVANDKGYSSTIHQYDINKSLLSFKAETIFTTLPNCYFVGIRTFEGETDLSTKFQLEEGSTATPYEPYQLVAPRTQTGLPMNGETNYVQLPSMTMDSIEIDCLIDSVQNGFHYIFDARVGGSSAFVYNNNVSVSQLFVNGVEKPNKNYGDMPKDERVILKFTFDELMDDVTIFARFTAVEKTKGILYGVKCYLDGKVVASYDFTNPNNIVGDKILNGSTKNLLPSFDDPEWNLHANAKVLGENVLKLDATASYQSSYLLVPALPNTNYYFNLFRNGRCYVQEQDESFNHIKYPYLDGDLNYNGSVASGFTTTPTTRYLRVAMNSIGSGTFDFVKPQLHKLDGKEGTIYGTVQPLLQSAKRTLFAKR